jgi:hypothetical protein
VVDAALADPAFAQLMDEVDFLRYDTGYLTYVPGSDRWYVGSCGRPEGAEIQYWRLGAVDPVSGEVLEFVEGFGNETCDPGTWPLSTDPMASPSGSPAEAAPFQSPPMEDGEPDPEDALASYATLPAHDSLTSTSSPFERLWQPFEAADIPFRYRCATEDSFTTMDLADATPTDEASDPLAEAIGHWGGWLGGAMDWHVVKQVDDRVLALAPSPGSDFPVEELELTRAITDGPGYETWDFAGGGDCRPEAVLRGGIAGRWRLDPRFPAPGRKTRTLHVLGYVGCNGTEKTGPARFHATDGAMLIAIPMGSTFNSDACSGLGPTRMTIALPEPLGRRTLYDAGSLPLRRIGPKTGLGIR